MVLVQLACRFGLMASGEDANHRWMLRTSDLEYDLPPERIATVAAEPRDAAKLMVLKRSDESFCNIVTVADLPKYLGPSDLLVFNATRVIPARLVGRKSSGGRVEGLYLGPGPAEVIDGVPRRTWIVMLGASHLHAGNMVDLVASGGDGAGGIARQGDSAVFLRLLRKDTIEPTAWVVMVEGSRDADLAILERFGYTPLPPYIRKARERAGIQVEDREDRARYQTVYAQPELKGTGRGVGTGEMASGGGGSPGTLAASVAAPTAGLHFTPRLLDGLRSKGVQQAHVTLHVGTGTFKSVETEFVEEHPMHEEWCSINREAMGQIERARQGGGRVIAVGTTAARTLESYARAVQDTGEMPESLSTRLLITPGYRWRWTDGLLTNFHLPRSTLLAMVGARLDSGEAGHPAGDGLERLKRAYAAALQQDFRFFSYGDAMLILP